MLYPHDSRGQALQGLLRKYSLCVSRILKSCVKILAFLLENILGYQAINEYLDENSEIIADLQR